MESIIVLVGFLGVGKTTLLKKLVQDYLNAGWNPNIILNDYENAQIDVQEFLSFLEPNKVSALSGSCICCSGVIELRDEVNQIKPREKGVTIIEANGTTDAVKLMGFLGVGMDDHFLPPVQVGVVDVRHWQQRGENNELEANQVQVSSLIVLNYTEDVDQERTRFVKEQIKYLNPKAKLIAWDDLNINMLSSLKTNDNEAEKMDHHRAHWSSCSVTLPDPIAGEKLTRIIDSIPQDILRIKGCTRVDSDENYTQFERTPSGDVFVKPYYGTPITGPKLLTIGPGSDPEFLQQLIDQK